MQRGLLINCTHDFTLRLLAAFIITRAQVREFLRLFELVLATTSRGLCFGFRQVRDPGALPMPRQVKNDYHDSRCAYFIVERSPYRAEWSPAHTRELLHLSADIRPPVATLHAARQIHRPDF